MIVQVSKERKIIYEGFKVKTLNYAMRCKKRIYYKKK